MKPVKQSILHDPANGKIGDCFRACMASLLELPIEEVPHVVADPALNKPGLWQTVLNRWLARRGLCFFEIHYHPDWRSVLAQCGVEVYHTMAGRSPRFPDEWHSVIGRNGEVVFDPHPDDTGLLGEPDSMGFLVRMCK